MKRTTKLILVLIILSISYVVSAQKPIALLVGVNDYIQGNSLQNPINDCLGIEKELTRLGWEVVVLKNSTSSNLIYELNKRIALSNSKNASSFLLYLSGHGFQLNDDNYLVCSDFNPDRFSLYNTKEGVVQLSEILHLFNKLNNIPKFVILDACRSNPIGKNSYYVSDGLAITNAPSNTLIAYSTAPGKIAFDGPSTLSPYAGAFISSLSQFQNCFDVFLNTRLLVANETRNEQIPWESNSLLKHFSFKYLSSNNMPVLATTNKQNTYDYNYYKLSDNSEQFSKNDIMVKVEDQMANIINRASISHFRQSPYLNKLDIDGLKKLYTETLKNILKNNIAWRYRNLSNIFQSGFMNPACRDNNGRLTYDCSNYDEVFIFYPDYDIARICAEEAYRLGGRCDVYGDLYRYGRGLKKDYLKAYDLYRESGKRGDEYYEVNINQMTQEILMIFGNKLKKDGSMGSQTKSMISKLIPDIGQIGRILTRNQFEKLINLLKNQ